MSPEPWAGRLVADGGQAADSADTILLSLQVLQKRPACHIIVTSFQLTQSYEMVEYAHLDNFHKEISSCV
jgi:hypothetical protein